MLGEYTLFSHALIFCWTIPVAFANCVWLYCSKYITKGNIRISNHRYFCSKSLKKPTISREYSPALTVLVSDWLEDNMQEPYAHNRMCKAYSIPKRIYKDLVEYIEKCKQKIAEKPWSFEEIDPCTFCLFDTWEQVTICWEKNLKQSLVGNGCRCGMIPIKNLA